MPSKETTQDSTSLSGQGSKEMGKYTGLLNCDQLSEEDFIREVERRNYNPYGYDLTLSNQWSRVEPSGKYPFIDSADPSSFISEHLPAADTVLVPPNDFVLGCTKETIEVPKDVLGLCFSRSSMVRIGLNVNITPFEAGWKGTVTIEIFNASRFPILVHADQKIGQVIFLRGLKPSIDYVSKGGRYQGQEGLVGSKGVT